MYNMQNNFELFYQIIKILEGIYAALHLPLQIHHQHHRMKACLAVGCHHEDLFGLGTL